MSGADTVQGLGFKDKNAVEHSVKVLEGRDPDYQKLATKGLIGRAKRVLQITKDEEKLNNIKEAIEELEKFLARIESAKEKNYGYLPLEIVEKYASLKNRRKLEDCNVSEFIDAYQKVGGDYKRLRTVVSGKDKPTWDIVRNMQIKKILEESKTDIRLWEEDNKETPSEIHISLIQWAYSPVAKSLKINQSDVKKGIKRKLDE